jgi:hypothetical protein
VRVLAILALAGCYDPSLRDCTVTCDSADPCAHDQVCNAEGFCVAAAGDRCTTDAAPLGSLHVTVMGHGSVQVPGGGTCGMDCTYMLPIAPITATAIESDGHKFQGWTTPNCIGRTQTCTFTLTAAQPLGAKFE